MWSVGVVIYGIFARSLPFKNVSRDFDFESAIVDYSGVPPLFRPLVQSLLSIDPASRPHATEARGFEALKSSQARQKFPLSAIPSEIDLSDRTDLVSRLSQVLRMPVGQLLAVLRGPRMTVEKLLFTLLCKKVSVMKTSPLFRGACRSLPVADRSPTTIQATFPTCASDVFRRLHSVTMGQRCYVSSPITLDPVIVQAAGAADRRIAFSCVDEDDAKRAVLTLVLPEEAGELAALIMEQMHAAFASAD
jgi:serine/threonine protein kinase